MYKLEDQRCWQQIVTFVNEICFGNTISRAAVMVLYVETSNRYVCGLVIVGTANFTYICDCYFKVLKIVISRFKVGLET
jgi:hypothetical protein